MTEYKEINLGFSTADAEHPSISYDDGVLSLKFTDWQEKEINVRFTEVIAFRWEDAFTDGITARDDTTYEIKNSAWLEKLKDSDALFGESDLDRFKHFRLCFNAYGPLDIICSGYE